MAPGLGRTCGVMCAVTTLLASACTMDDASSLASSQASDLSGGDPARGSCVVSAPGDAGKVIAATLLLPDAPAEKELFVDRSGVIRCAASSCAHVPGYASATRITCRDAVVSPGLVNPHDHLSFANNPPHRPTRERYEHRHDWRKGARNHTKIPVQGRSVANAVEAAELRFVMSGVTAVAGSGGARGLLRNLDESPSLHGPGLSLESARTDTFPLGDSNLTTFPTRCEAFTGRRTTAAQIADLEAYLPHIAEGIDASAHAEIVCQSDGVPGQDHSRYDLLTGHTAVIHGVAVQADDVRRYAIDDAILVWSPRSNIDLYGNTAPIALYANLGVRIALGTDWLPSGSMNMARELRCADELNRGWFDGALTDEQLWQSVTVHAAAAVGARGALGELREGLAGDVAIFDAKGRANPYRAVIEAGVEDTILVLRAGEVLYGDRALVRDLEATTGGTPCEDLDVCNVPKKACVKRDLGDKTLADLQRAASLVYPLFFCKDTVPMNEPSCVPRRDATPGAPLASSYDGPRPGDRDGDGIGDACDRCPFDAGESCDAPAIAR